MVTTAGRQSICSRRWSPPIRRPCSLTWRALTASCLSPSLIDPRHLPRRVWSKELNASPRFLLLSSHLSVMFFVTPCSRLFYDVFAVPPLYSHVSMLLSQCSKLLEETTNVSYWMIIDVRRAAEGWALSHSRMHTHLYWLSSFIQSIESL